MHACAIYFPMHEHMQSALSYKLYWLIYNYKSHCVLKLRLFSDCYMEESRP